MKTAGFNIRIALSALFIALTAGFAVAQPQTPYQQGLEQLYRGNTTEALSTWQEYYDEQERVDSRVGIEYIRVVTSNNISDRFDDATNMYYKALTNGVGVNSRIAIRQEIERLKPIVGDGIYRQWTEWWDEENSELHSDMRGYWVQLDPTPSTQVNERLIEHWKRIASAQKQFTRNSSTIYGTDDRALIYVRYGEPDRVQRGILTLQDLNIKPWLQRQMLQQEPDRSERGGDRRPWIERQEEILENAIYDFHRYPEYEVWFYDNMLEDSNDSLPFIFGTNAENDQFEYHSSIDALIPERAFYPDQRRGTDRDRDRDTEPGESAQFVRAGITPALMLQMLYYEQLTPVDPYFENRLNTLRTRVLEQGIDALQGLDLAFRTESADIINRRAVRASRQLSSFRSQLPQVPIGVYQYRFLDEDLNPYLITFLESTPKEAFLIDFNRNRPSGLSLEEVEQAGHVEEILPQYSLSHSLQLYDSGWNVTDQKQENPPIHLNRDTQRDVSSTVFTLPHETRMRQSASVELMNSDDESRPIFETPYPKTLRGLGSVHFRQPEPLQSHPDSLQFADLVLGYQMLEESDTPFSFIVANDQVIPWQETLVLHFEVYNLQMQDNGFSQFELTYRILPVDDDGNIETDRTEFVLTLNFTSEEPRLIEALEIETADLTPGLYELQVDIIDVNTHQEKYRSTRFEVVE